MREAAAIGFYPGEKDALEKEVKKLLTTATPKKAASAKSGAIVGAIVPHAGYIYSGKTAAAVFSLLRKGQFDSVIILCPNHTGVGEDFSISIEDWETPLGTVKNDTELGKEVSGNCKMIAIDDLAHTYEHSAEVQLPFLQTALENFSIVPICISSRLSSLENCEIIGDAIKMVCEKAKKAGKKILLVASSDFTHLGESYGFFPPEAKKDPVSWIKKTDRDVIDAILDLDAKKTFELGRKTTVCGIAPIVTLLFALKGVAKKASLIDYGTSYDVSKDKSMIVGYTGIVFEG